MFTHHDASRASWRLATAQEAAMLLRAALPAALAGLLALVGLAWIGWTAARRTEAAILAPPPEPGAVERLTLDADPPEGRP